MCPSSSKIVDFQTFLLFESPPYRAFRLLLLLASSLNLPFLFADDALLLFFLRPFFFILGVYDRFPKRVVAILHDIFEFSL